MDRPQICRRAAQGNRPGSWFLYRDWIRDRSVFMPKNKRSVNNAEIWCFYIFHRFALKYAKGHTMLRWSASKIFITSRQNVEKCIQCWDQPLPNLLLGRARDIGKIIVFQGKRIHFRITGILEKSIDFQQKINNLSSEQKYLANCNKFAQKIWEMWNFKKLWECVTKKQKRERGERGEESKNSKEREGSKRARKDLIHALTPDPPPLAAITGSSSSSSK